MAFMFLEISFCTISNFILDLAAQDSTWFLFFVLISKTIYKLKKRTLLDHHKQSSGDLITQNLYDVRAISTIVLVLTRGPRSPEHHES